MRARTLASWRMAAFLLTPLAGLWPANAVAAVAVDLQLVIAADTSSSIDDREAALEREGVVSAFRSPEVVSAIRQGALGKIAVLYLDWSGGYNNVIVSDWRVISDKASANAFADTLARAPRTYGRGTDIGAALQQAALLITASSVASNGFQGTRRAIDVSGDGPMNTGRPVAEVRDEVVKEGITINGLPIVTDEYGGGDWGAYPGQLDQYYQHCIIGGRGAFILPAKGFEEFVAAMRRKLVLEISDARPVQGGIIKVAAQTGAGENPLKGAAPSSGKDCSSQPGYDVFRGGRGFGGFGGGRGGGF
jgi:hypothetical protein